MRFISFVDQAAALRARCARWGRVETPLTSAMLRALTPEQVEQIVRVATADESDSYLPLRYDSDGRGSFFCVPIPDGDTSDDGFIRNLIAHIERVVRDVATAESRVKAMGDDFVVDTDAAAANFGEYAECYGVRFADEDAARTLVYYAWDSPVTQAMVAAAKQKIEAARIRREADSSRASA